MEINDNPPSEREWTPQEMEEYFSSNDPILGIPNASMAGAWPRTTGIHVTHIVPPAYGWPIAMHCPICKETTFILSPWAAKPEKGDYWRINNQCAGEGVHNQHNMKFAMDMYDLATKGAKSASELTAAISGLGKLCQENSIPVSGAYYPKDWGG
jgi:hypothetical protein